VTLPLMVNRRIWAWLSVRMARQEKLRAVVLSRRSVGEADRLVTMLTREQGLLRVLAKGVRKIPSRRGGHMEPLTQVLALISGSPGRYWLRAIETEEYFYKLHDDRRALGRARRLAHIVVNLFEEETAYPRLFDALRQACEVLPELTYPKQSLLEVATIMLALREGGIMPLLNRCQRCGARRSDEAVVLDASQGGWLCLTCLPAGQAGLPAGQAKYLPLARAQTSLNPRVFAVLRYLAAYPEKALKLSVDEEEARQLITAARLYISTLTMRVPAV